MMDFSQASTKQASNGELIPDGTLAWAIVEIRPHNIEAGIVPVPSGKTPTNKYLDIELTVAEGEFEKRKMWDMVGVEGSPAYTEMGAAAIRHMLEVGKRAGPTNPSGYSINDYMDLSGLRVAVEVRLEKGKAKGNGEFYPDKNRVKYLSPNPESDTHKNYAKLVAGETQLPVKAQPAQSQPAAQVTAPAAAPPAKPAWLSK